MKYGYFDDPNREYVITDPQTPVTWINYLGTLKFGGFVNQTGGLLICKGDPALNRITKYIPQLPASDFKGATLYLRIKAEGRYHTFAPLVVPTMDECDDYACRVGPGYTRIDTEMYGIRTSILYFVPLDGERLIQDIIITNLNDEVMEIDAIPVIEYSHPDALKQFTNADWVPQTMQSRAIEQPGGYTILCQYPFMKKDTGINYYTSNYPVASYDTDRRTFLGFNEFGSWADPESLQNPDLANSEAHRGDNIAALLHHLGRLEAGDSRRLITQLGQVASVEKALPAIERYRNEREVEAAFEELGQFWEAYLSKYQCATPDVNFNRILNLHNPRQCYITKNWSRYLSLYQLGFGARGIGFRDSSQDVLGILASAPEEGRALIHQMLHTQRQNGSAMHQFNPLTMVASIGEAGSGEGVPDYYSDDHLWIILAVSAYLKETGDFAFLDMQVPYYEKGGDGKPLEQGTVLDHMDRAIEFTRADVGRHGLPLAGFADWNDTVNLRAGAESLFTANLFGVALRELIQLASELEEVVKVAKYLAYYKDMQERVNEHGWDGQWYLRYFDADGSPIGSQTNKQGQIFANGQSWPVLSGFASPERARKALDAVYTHLNTSQGIKLSWPGYNGYDPNKGGVTTYPPGAKENGGIFLHANPWVIIAETKMGNGDRAYEYYNQINPVIKNDEIDQYECEPYVYPQNILGDEHPQFGLARNSWLTGTASWAYQAGTQYILGVRPVYDGLMIDPCIPRYWSSFKVRRDFRGARYEIDVRNPDHVSYGIQEIIVDGEPLAGNVLPIFRDGKTHSVFVLMGAQSEDRPALVSDHD